MLPLVMLLVGHATFVAVRPESEITCPTPVQVNLALGARVPTAVVAADQATQTGALLLELAPDASGATRLRLVSPEGEERLQRVLTTEDGPSDCAALADTVALIVDRFLVDLDDRLAADASAGRTTSGRRWDLSVAAGWRSGGESNGGMVGLLRVDRLLGVERRFQLSLSAGVSGRGPVIPAGSSYYGQATVRRIPVELGFWWLQPLQPGELQLGITGGLEITRVNAQSDMVRRDDLFPGPVAAANVGLRFGLGDHAFFRLTTSLSAALVRYQFYYHLEPGSPRLTVFSSPPQRLYAKIAGELGIALPMTKKRGTGP